MDWPFLKPRDRPSSAVENPPTTSAPFEAVTEALLDPVLVIEETSGGLRIVFSNAAARSTLPGAVPTALLAVAVRRPEVIETAMLALSGESADAPYETGGAVSRALRVFGRPLPPGAAGERCALLTFRDETDARRNERMRADFLANAGHELRTPLASIAGFIETLRGHAKDDPKARERFLDVMADQAARMDRLIAGLMNLSRVELNEHVAPSGEVDLIAALRDVIDAAAPRLAQGKVAVVFEPPGETVLVRGDRDQIVQVLVNLLDNAVKYSPTAGTVRIALEPPPPTALALLDPPAGASLVHVGIGDQGSGVPREHLPRLTERFYRTPGQTGATPGSGLGLAIVKHILGRHGGGLWVESAAGAGARFTAGLPRI